MILAHIQILHHEFLHLSMPWLLDNSRFLFLLEADPHEDLNFMAGMETFELHLRKLHHQMNILITYLPITLRKLVLLIFSVTIETLHDQCTALIHHDDLRDNSLLSFEFLCHLSWSSPKKVFPSLPRHHSYTRHIDLFIESFSQQQNHYQPGIVSIL